MLRWVLDLNDYGSVYPSIHLPPLSALTGRLSQRAREVQYTVNQNQYLFFLLVTL